MGNTAVCCNSVSEQTAWRWEDTPDVEPQRCAGRPTPTTPSSSHKIGDESNLLTPTSESAQLATLLPTNRYVKAKTQQPLPDSGATQNEQELAEMLSVLELTANSIASRYRLAVANKADPQQIKNADEVLARVGAQFKRLQHFKLRGQTWQDGEADKWVNMFVGQRRRFKSLAEIVRKVQVENRIVKHWQGQARSGSKMPTNTSDELLNSLETSAGGPSLLDTWHGVNVFKVEKESQQPLATVFMSIWCHQDLGRLSKARSSKVVDYIRAVESGYKQNPYHNRIHAAEVTCMAYSFWQALSSSKDFEGYFTQVDLLVLIFAAAIHDVGHPAVNNDFLVKTKSNLALRYHDRAVLENFHIATAFELLKDKGIPILDHNLPSPPVASLRERIVDMVLATDMAVHKPLVEEMQKSEMQNQNRQDIDKRLLERGLIHLSDIGHALRPVEQHQEWARRVTEEMFAQGDREKDLGLTPMALFDRKQALPLSKNQVGFLNFVVMPTFKPVAMLLSQAAKEPEECLQRNISAWQAMVERDEASNKAAA
eukprot:TRINITY_DN17379_c0_g1_i1.p1 TRINITY_DN17379_c0_g1~~TRINITY_DN17379_c0_g1_i1.p1  ORF type:complete len:540 (+),score=127.93 TRINITY_DN17379_c0_g1_i1:115-1734(+)